MIAASYRWVGVRLSKALRLIGLWQSGYSCINMRLDHMFMHRRAWGQRPLLPRVVRPLPANGFNAARIRPGCQGWSGRPGTTSVTNRLTARGVRRT